MLRLQALYEGSWQVVAEVDQRGHCPLQDELDDLANNKGTRAVAVGLLALWVRIPREGPHRLPVESFHCINSKHEIYEFVKGRYRFVCFLADGRLIVCTSAVLKKTQKAPKSAVDHAAELRRRYQAAVKAGEIEIVEKVSNHGAKK
ncbi:type II toxin-antitoxin system RelE/ParE family toxin [Xanthomonas translucens pv. translucens]|uniref:type II toxin-antitoxin system RelE/ParE family toxin n=1 Tax=Xanthomonas campestris pv. translucens TaxID=343 RepID=UPI003F7112CB